MKHITYYVVVREYPVFSDDAYEGPPVPISNTVVKLIEAEDTCPETDWESRKLLINERTSGS